MRSQVNLKGGYMQQKYKQPNMNLSNVFVEVEQPNVKTLHTFTLV